MNSLLTLISYFRQNNRQNERQREKAKEVDRRTERGVNRHEMEITCRRKWNTEKRQEKGRKRKNYGWIDG